MEKRLSQLSIKNLILDATREDYDKIIFENNNILNENNTYEKYDVGIVFGGVSMLPFRTDKALELFKNGIVNRLVLTGGIGFMNLDRKTSEANKMYDYLLEKGLPKYALLKEQFSRNTVENIRNTLRIVKCEYGDIAKLKICLITSDFHLKRCLNLFNNAIEYQTKVVGCGIQDGVRDRENWYLSWVGMKQIVIETYALNLYSKKGIIEDQVLPGLTLDRKKIK